MGNAAYCGSANTNKCFLIAFNGIFVTEALLGIGSALYLVVY